MSSRNKGIEQRILNDKKTNNVGDDDDENEESMVLEKSREALERKSKIYQQKYLQTDGDDDDESSTGTKNHKLRAATSEEEEELVDFDRKWYHHSNYSDVHSLSSSGTVINHVSDSSHWMTHSATTVRLLSNSLSSSSSNMTNNRNESKKYNFIRKAHLRCQHDRDVRIAQRQLKRNRHTSE